jgi:Flp pilus assembly secretin CpaC
VTGAKDTNVADVAPQASGLVLTDSVQPPVVSDAVLVTGSTLASARKYSKPADRTIQVGTIALTTMRVGGRDVLKCEVDDSSVCRAIVTADGEVALLPGKVGVTRATLWIKEPNGQPKVETADIQVGETLPIDGKDSVEIEKLNESLQRLYPNTTLRIVASDRCIEICGEADTEQQAREVLQLVRKLCLVPVKDKVTVR